jgi:hypothetical protein
MYPRIIKNDEMMRIANGMIIILKTQPILFRGPEKKPMKGIPIRIIVQTVVNILSKVPHGALNFSLLFIQLLS